MSRVCEVKYIEGYTVWMRFEDGTQGEIDLEAELTGPVFGPLRDTSLFSKVSLYRDFGAIAWPNGADLSYEFLYQCIHERAA